MIIPTIKELYNLGYFSGLDYHFARTMGRMAGEEDPLVLLAAGAVSRFTRQGHVCLDLSGLAGIPFISDDGEILGKGRWPERENWLAALEKSSLVARCNVTAPLVMDDGGRLYLARYWQYQERLAEQLKRRGLKEVDGVDRGLLEKGLDRLFPKEEGVARDEQRLAAETSVLRHLTVVTGGPGTGKTFTVVKILELLIEQALSAGEEAPRILLAAPTGKAAARLKESIAGAKVPGAEKRSDSERVFLDLIPEEAFTIHRMLGIGYSGKAATRVMSTDVIVVDEASMVDLSLMTKLITAVPENARLILLGDKDQLSSVEAGAILGDICKGGANNKGEGIGKSIVHLTRSYRFDGGSGIGAFAAAIRDGDSRSAMACLKDDDMPEVMFVPLGDAGQLPGVLSEIVRKGYLPYFLEEETTRRWKRFNAFRILCAHRRGVMGVDGINAWVENFLLNEAGLEPGRVWYDGRPVMVERNDYQLNLFNGDIGVAMHSETAEGEIGVYFPGSGEEAGRTMMPSRLPPHRTVYAMSVHKSQGSEFDEVVLVLPPRRSPVVTRELLYTAVTRVRGRVTILGTEKVIREAVETPVQRASGLEWQLRVSEKKIYPDLACPSTRLLRCSES